jgi:hypothetical protein
MHVAKRTGDQHGRPIGVACGRPLIEQGQDAEGGLGSVFRLGAAVAGLAETREPIRGVAHPPFGRRANRAADFAGDGARRGAIRRHQNDPRLEAKAIFGLRAAYQAIECCALFTRQYNRGRFAYAAQAALNHDSAFRDRGY